MPQRLHRIQPRRAHGGQHAEEHARDALATSARRWPRRHLGRDRRRLRMSAASSRADDRPIDRADERQRRRLDQELQRMTPRVAPSALRTPISRVRSVTEIIMIATTPTPPTISPTAESDEHHEEEHADELLKTRHLVLRRDARSCSPARAQAALHAQRGGDVVDRRVACVTPSRGFTVMSHPVDVDVEAAPRRSRAARSPRGTSRRALERRRRRLGRRR